MITDLIVKNRIYSDDADIQRASEIINGHTRPSSARAYFCDLRYWQAWLNAIGYDGGTITVEHIEKFIIQHTQGLDPQVHKKTQSFLSRKTHAVQKITTIRRKIVSLSVALCNLYESNPCKSPRVRMLLRKIASSTYVCEPKKAICKDMLTRVIDDENNDLITLRNNAIFAFGWSSGGRRSSEIAAAQLSDLYEHKDGSFVYRMPRSKNDPQARGLSVPIKGKPAEILKKWLVASGVKRGPIFRPILKSGRVLDKPLHSAMIGRFLKKRIRDLGIDDREFGGHSLRSGFVTEAGRQGKPLGDIMALTGHKSVAIAMHYYQAGNVESNSASELWKINE